MEKEKEEEKSERLEETDDVQVGSANVGTFNLIVYAILTVICLIYLFTHFSPPQE